ncbi:hypothetical protein N7448_008646 [Penicillium atrosanguineum]|nr:hypothetical protein N7448_008646 [Penicillium atrosanguineum]
MEKRPPHSRAVIDHEFQRAYKACTPCARRKVKCLPGDGDKCIRCNRQQLNCVFSSKKPWSRPSKNGVESQPLRRSRILRNSIPSSSQSASLAQPETQDEGLPASMLQRVVSNNKDAMSILFEAALCEEPRDAPARREPYNTQISQTPNEMDTVQIWNAHRFVKMGWFTAKEAMSLVDLFFANLNPLSPILTDFYACHKNHFYLVTQEPMLSCVILMISSRYHTLAGVGSSSRAFFIHQRLWQHCQHLLLRLSLGQEKISKAKTRNIGSIEALILLSEWHPRALQSPPEADGWDSDFLMSHLDARDPPLPTEETPVSDRWREDVVEPTKRFERMSWMVLSSALALAHELGAFGPTKRLPKPDDLVRIDAAIYLEHLELRRQRLPSLLFVYINVLSTRIGCTSPISPEVEVSPPDSTILGPIDHIWLSFMNSWIKLTRLTCSTMAELSPLVNTTSGTRSPGSFVSILEGKQMLLSDWHRQNLSTNFMESPFMEILFIEYQHLRILINSVGMQKIVQKVLEQNSLQSGSTIDYPFIEKARQTNMTVREYGFIEEVIDGCCQTLGKVAALGTAGSLHYSPMRLLFRTISSSIFLMKALALGVRNSKLQEALQILDRAICALQDDNQDDVHLKAQYAILLKIQASKLRRSLVSSHQTGSLQKTQSSDPGRALQLPETAPPHAQPIHQQGTENEISLDNFSNFDFNDWLSLPFDPSMAPFGPYEGDFGVRMDGVDLDLDFLWQLPA